MAAFQAAGRGSIPRARSISIPRKRPFSNAIIPPGVPVFRCLSMSVLVTCCLLAGGAVLPASAASSPTAKIQPKKVAINKKATLVGSHFQAREIYTVLLAVPNLQHAKTKRFVAVGRSDDKGNLHL